MGPARGWGCAVLAWLLLAGLAAGAQARVILVGIDGASWNVIDPMIAAGELPTFAALSQRGVTAELRTVKPVNSPAVWTSIATSRSPRVHGVTDFYSTSASLRVPTVFERLAARGLRVGLYDYLVTWPPVVLPRGFVVPGWLRKDTNVTPPDLWEKIELGSYVYGYADERTPEDYLALSARELDEKAARWNQLTAAFDVEVGGVTFYSLDMISHRFWKAAFPEAFGGAAGAAPATHESAIRDALVGIDRSLREIADELGPDDTLLVASDHGFRASGEPEENIWVAKLEGALARADLDPERDHFDVATTFGVVILHVHAGPFAEREATLLRLLELLASYRGPADAAIFAVEVMDTVDRPPGERRSVFDRLRQWGFRLIVKYIFKLNVEREGHAFVFARPRDDALSPLWPDGEIRVAGDRVPLRDAFVRDSFSGEHDPTGVFLAAGGPIEARAKRARLSVLDIGPLIFYLAGAPIPDDLEGELRVDWIRPSHLHANQPRTADAAAMPGIATDATAAVEPRDDDPELTKRLRSLGYVE